MFSSTLTAEPLAPRSAGNNQINEITNNTSTPRVVFNSSSSQPYATQRISAVDIAERIATVKEDLNGQLRETLGINLQGGNRFYRKPDPPHFDMYSYHNGWRVPEFVKFNGDDGRTTREHVSQYLAQLGEANTFDALKVCFFSLSLTGTTFSWFSSLPPNSIFTWGQLELKFHDHFYSGGSELKLPDLTSVRQKHEESVNDYIRRFKDVNNRCFNDTLSQWNLADLAFGSLHSYLREKLDGHDLLL